MSRYVDIRHCALTLARTMTTIDKMIKIAIFCNDVKKTSTSVELLAINILRYMSQRSNVGLGIKSTADRSQRRRSMLKEFHNDSRPTVASCRVIK